MDKAPGQKKSRAGARGARKVKTGCLTCKIRHKKCDERKPSCLPCTSTGRRCDFLQLSGQVALINWSLKGVLWNTPRLHLIDTWHFEYFRVVSVPELSQCLGTGVWESIILPATYAESSILSGVLALAALGRNMTPSSSSGKMALAPGFPESYALHKYNQAIRELNNRLDASPSSREVALLASLVFTVIDVHRGREDLARVHLQAAVTILRDLGEAGAGGSLVRSDLVYAISNLASVSFDQIRSGNQYLNSPVHISPSSQKFNNISEARDSLNVISGAIKSLLWKRAVSTQGLRQSPYVSVLTSNTASLSNQLDSWRSRFSDLITRGTVDAETKSCTYVLLIHHQLNKLYISTYLYPSHHNIHSKTIQFSAIINFAEIVLKAEQESRANTGLPHPGHSLDVAVIQPLFFTAHHCKDATLRRRAIEFLEQVKSDSIHESRLLARVARWVVITEETTQFDSRASATMVDENNVLHDVEFDFNDLTGDCTVTAWRKTQGQWVKIVDRLPPNA
ncbi:hypothetical protein F5Y16DRAFT_235520 [Xylariaceae sp. FL0255]|nr:hypothetical protein F5Y16DRAFT_235520 [Xylariaceae sp. FL0255]